jgi:hypothetical protein
MAFRMHTVTSSLFLPILVKHLSASSQAKLLKGYLHICMAWYVSRGCPDFDIPGLFDRPAPHYSSHLPASALHSVLPSSQVTPNPWTYLVEYAILHQDDHFCKVIRTLVHYAGLYGTRKAGRLDFVETGLKNVERIDGTLFLRAADIALQRMSRPRDPSSQIFDLWDLDGFY